MPLAITPATPDDVPAIHAMVLELAEFEHLTHLCTSSVEALADALFGPAPVAEVLLGHCDGVLAGFALFYPNYSTFLGKRGLWLEDLYIRPASRGRGLGRALLARIASIAHARGCGRFEWSVLDWNARAIAFYEALGATVMPDWRIARITGPALDRLAARGQD
jgi:GNAT superfamily N-acetyltransferase